MLGEPFVYIYIALYRPTSYYTLGPVTTGMGDPSYTLECSG